MTCRHSPGDPNCTTQFPKGYSYYYSIEPLTPDSKKFEIAVRFNSFVRESIKSE